MHRVRFRKTNFLSLSLCLSLSDLQFIQQPVGLRACITTAREGKYGAVRISETENPWTSFLIFRNFFFFFLSFENASTKELEGRVDDGGGFERKV